jgi:hypothetical protein
VHNFDEADVYPRNASTPEKLEFAEELLFNTKWVVDVGTTTDADLRAHRVALTYHYFARDLDRCINGPDSVWWNLEERRTPRVRDANWFNFGTWATTTINRDLTLRQPPAGTDRLIPYGLRRAATPLLLHVRAADGQRVSRALGWGQRLVFLSMTFTHLARRTKKDDWGLQKADAKKDNVFQRILEWSKWNGTEYIDPKRHLEAIWSAFDHFAYAAAVAKRVPGYRMVEADDEAPAGSPALRLEQGRLQRLEAIRSRHIFYANLLLTAVEQEIVNQAVGAVIDTMPQYLSSVAIGRMAAWGERFLGVQRELTGRNLPLQLRPVTHTFRESWARFMTEQVMVMMLPCETLRLGRDLPPLYPGKPFFPPDLSDLTSLPGADLPDGDADLQAIADHDPTEQLRLLVTAFDRSRGNGQGTGARDWRNYSDRMNWATTLLRSRQQDLSLFWAPYSDEDESRIYRGRLPHRFGDPSEYDVNAPFTNVGGPHAPAESQVGGTDGQDTASSPDVEAVDLTDKDAPSDHETPA